MKPEDDSSAFGEYLSLTIAGIFLAAALMALAAAGCGGPSARAPIGHTTWSWTDGRMIRVYNLPYETVWLATCATVHEYRLAVGYQDHDGLAGRIDAQRVDDLGIHILIENLGEDRARITVTVGIGGQKALSAQLLRAIDRKLLKAGETADSPRGVHDSTP